MNNYNKSFQITENVGNNVFCFDKISNPKLYVPKLIKWNISDIKIWKNTVFREEKKWEIIEYKWLKDFIVISSEWNESRNLLNISNKEIPPLQSKWQSIYIVDNHNHALYFRYKEYFAWNIKKWIDLIHIDQHTDMNKLPPLLKGGRGDFKTLNGIFQITNYHCNVWNFIQPAIQDWLIFKIHQINTEYSLLNIPLKRGTKGVQKNYILDIDLDFRSPEMSIQQYNKTIEITKKLIQNSRVVTIATSPYFLDQNLAIKILKDLLN